MKSIATTIINNINLTMSVKIFFINPDSENEQDHEVSKLNIDNSVVKVAKRIVREFANQIIEKQQIAIEDIDKEDEDFIITAPISEIDYLQNYINMINSENYITFNAHKADGFLKRLKFYIIQIKINKEIYYFIRKYSASKLFAPKQFCLVVKQNTFEHVDNTNFFMLDKAIDAFVKNDIVYIVNDKQFSLMTKYYKKEIAKASVLLDELENSSFIHNFPQLKEFCLNRISYIKRICKLDKDVISNITFNSILSLCTNRGTNFIINERSKTISFETNEQLKNIIDLILDNFLVSEVTGLRYRGINKRKDKAAI